MKESSFFKSDLTDPTLRQFSAQRACEGVYWSGVWGLSKLLYYKTTNEILRKHSSRYRIFRMHSVIYRNCVHKSNIWKPGQLEPNYLPFLELFIVTFNCYEKAMLCNPGILIKIEMIHTSPTPRVEISVRCVYWLKCTKWAVFLNKSGDAQNDILLFFLVKL